MLSVIAILALASAGGADPWPLERQDRYGTGQAVAGLAPSEYSTPWRHIEFGGGFISSHGPSFGADRFGYIGRWVDNTVRKFDPLTGAIVGTIPSGNFVQSTPAIGATRVFFSTDNNMGAGAVISINRAGLFIEWLNNTGSISGSPNLGPEGDVVYMRNNGEINRVSESTGTPVWTKPGFSNPKGTVMFLRSDNQVVFSHGNSVTALNWSDGSLAWTYNSGSKNGGVAVAPDGSVVFGNELGRVIALTSAGVHKWTRFTTNVVNATPAFGFDGEVYIGSHDWAVYAYRLSDGLPLWNFLTNHWIDRQATVDVNGRIYIQSRLGNLYCLNPNGTLIWTRQIGGDPRGPMTFDGDGTLYVPYVGNFPAVSGMVSVRLDAPKLLFSLTQVNPEITATGGNETLTDIDSNRMSFLSGTSTPFATNVVAQFEATTPKRDLDQLVLETNLNLTQAAPVDFKADVFNYTTGQWVPVPIFTRMSTTPNTFALTFAPLPTQAVEMGTNKIKVRLTVTRFVKATSQWGIEIDKVGGKVIPTF